MRLELVRFGHGETSTLGALSVDGFFECYTLEDERRAVKVRGETRIPEGEYQLGLRDSPKFGPDSLWVKNVPGFEWIMIHVGNYQHQTDGCILVGKTAEIDAPDDFYIGRSTMALKDLKAKLVPAIKRGEDARIVISSRS